MAINRDALILMLEHYRPLLKRIFWIRLATSTITQQLLAFWCSGNLMRYVAAPNFLGLPAISVPVSKLHIKGYWVGFIMKALVINLRVRSTMLDIHLYMLIKLCTLELQYWDLSPHSTCFWYFHRWGMTPMDCQLVCNLLEDHGRRLHCCGFHWLWRYFMSLAVAFTDY